jgi:hypothetical protein
MKKRRSTRGRKYGSGAKRSVARLDPARPLGVAALALAGLGMGTLLRPLRRTRGLRAGWLRLVLGAAAAVGLAVAGLAASVPQESKGEP